MNPTLDDFLKNSNFSPKERQILADWHKYERRNSPILFKIRGKCGEFSFKITYEIDGNYIIQIGNGWQEICNPSRHSLLNDGLQLIIEKHTGKHAANIAKLRAKLKKFSRYRRTNRLIDAIDFPTYRIGYGNHIDISGDSGFIFSLNLPMSADYYTEMQFSRDRVSFSTGIHGTHREMAGKIVEFLHDWTVAAPAVPGSSLAFADDPWPFADIFIEIRRTCRDHPI